MSRAPRSISGRVVAITGGARGIGRATAHALARQGARVAIGDIDGDLAAYEAADLGGHAFGVGFDVTDNAAFAAFLDGVEHRLGPLDVLINNAGIMTTGLIEDEDEELTDREIAINLHAVIHGTREAVRRMKPRQSGHIVNVSSAGGRIAGAGVATYCATKFGVAGFSEAVALELRDTGVEISVVLPPPVRTSMAAGLTPLRGMPFLQPQDIAEAIVKTLERPRFDVPVPRSLGAVLWVNRALPSRARAMLAHFSKADDIVDQIDMGERAGYAARLEQVKGVAAERRAGVSSRD